jgi:hypothetical protein
MGYMATNPLSDTKSWAHILPRELFAVPVTKSVSEMKKLLIFLYRTARSFVPTFLERGESGSCQRDWVLTFRVCVASSCGMHQTLAKCSALTPLDLPEDTAAIVANAVTNCAEILASNISQAESSIETLPAAIDTCDMWARSAIAAANSLGS